MPSRAALHRLVPLFAAGAVLACAALPAGAHTGQDDRPGAVQVDLEVLVTPALTGETTPGGQDPGVAVDSHGNVLATALKEDDQVATVDGRASTHLRAGSWRWSSGDDGASYTNVSGRPLQADGLVPGGRSVAAAADDRGRGYLLEAHDGVGVLTVTRSTEQDDITAESVQVLPAAMALNRTRLAAHGDGRLFLLATDRSGPYGVYPLEARTSGYAFYRSEDAGGSLAELQGVTLAETEECDVAAGHAPGSKQVAVACTMFDGSVAAFRSNDDGRTLARSTILKPSSLRRERPSVAISRDGTVSVLVVTSSSDHSAMSLLRSRGTSRSWTRQEVAAEPGRWSGASLAVNKRGRLGLAAYHLAPGRAGQAGSGWHVRLAVFDAGRTPLFVDFASHDPVAPPDWATAPDAGTAIAAGPDDRFHLLWTGVKLPAPDPIRGQSLVRNVWSVRTLST